MAPLVPRVSSVGRELLTAEAAALAAQETEQYILISTARDALEAGIGKAKAGHVKLDVTDQILSGRLNLTIGGASTVTLGIHDPDWIVENSGLLDLDADGRMGDIDIALNGIWFRLVQASRQDGSSLSLTFEDVTVALLRERRKPMKASRGSMTRAEFIEKQVNELPAAFRLFYSPEKGIVQATETPRYPDATPAEGTTGFDAGAKFKIANAPATAAQKREAAIVMTVCDQLNVNDHVRRAAIIAAIGESGFRAVMNRGGSPYGGVFQGNVRDGTWNLNDTEGMARCFLLGGKGFQGGGAIAINKANPRLPEGAIAYTVEGNISNFGGSTSAATQFYQRWIGEAKAIAAAWKGSSPTSPDTVLRVKTYQFTRGLPGRKESSWDSATRLAAEVNWRFYVAGGVAVFASDDFLISRPAQITLDDPFGDEILDRPSYDWDHGKTIGEVTLTVDAGRWSVRPGNVAVLAGNKWGPLQGRWLIHDIDQNLFESTDCTITLTKAIKPRKEPAAEVEPETSGDNEQGTGSIVYVGDSLAVGTLPHLRRILGRKSITNDVVTGRTSATGVTALEALFRSRRFDNVIFDLGTNDTTSRQLKDSIQRARKIAPQARIYVLTVNGPFDSLAKNKMIRSWGDSHVRVIDWQGYAKRAGIAFDSIQGSPVHPQGDGYKKRAALIAREMGFA